MAQRFVHISRDKARPNVLLVTIDNPPANAMTLVTYRELIELLALCFQSDSHSRDS